MSKKSAHAVFTQAPTISEILTSDILYLQKVGAGHRVQVSK